MTPKQIRDWAKNPAAKEASFEATRRRLPALARLRAKPSSDWDASDRRFAQRVVSFNSRMRGMLKKFGCTRKVVISLRNWGHQPRSCAVPGRS